MCEKLKELIPRQQFGYRHTGRDRRQDHRRETVKAVRKDVTAKCHGGDTQAQAARKTEERQETHAPG